MAKTRDAKLSLYVAIFVFHFGDFLLRYDRSVSITTYMHKLWRWPGFFSFYMKNSDTKEIAVWVMLCLGLYILLSICILQQRKNKCGQFNNSCLSNVVGNVQTFYSNLLIDN